MEHGQILLQPAVVATAKKSKKGAVGVLHWKNQQRKRDSGLEWM